METGGRKEEERVEERRAEELCKIDMHIKQSRDGPN